MKKLIVTAEQAKKIEAKLPAGRTISDIRLVRCSAKIDLVENLGSDAKDLIAKAVETSGAPPLLTQGQPTIMRIVAWMTHEGVNKNRQAFLADDLGPAADAIRIPNVLPMDWNHSAFRMMSTDDKAIGVWYTAEKRWDQEAKDGKGAYGIMVQGIMWSWLFPKYATDMMAAMQRDRELSFSMACLPTSVETARDADGPYEILHKPVFLTNSALDVPAADPDADGIGVEGSNDPDLETYLTKVLTQSTIPEAQLPLAASLTKKKEEQMDELETKVAELSAKLEAASAQIALLVAAESKLVVAETKLTESNVTIESLRTELTEVTTSRDALVASAAAAATEMAAITAELETAKAALAEVAAVEEAAVAKARYETRLATLPESYREALSKRSPEEQTRFSSKWTSATDEAWTDFAADIQFAFQNVRISYAERTAAEGGALPNADTGNDEVATLVSSIKR